MRHLSQRPGQGAALFLCFSFPPGGGRSCDRFSIQSSASSLSQALWWWTAGLHLVGGSGDHNLSPPLREFQPPGDTGWCLGTCLLSGLRSGGRSWHPVGGGTVAAPHPIAPRMPPTPTQRMIHPQCQQGPGWETSYWPVSHQRGHLSSFSGRDGPSPSVLPLL